ncbi:hypothetical protein [Paraburkholderia hospita]|jgi:hypothetical protein|uniref:Major facilitator superfamily protein n=1 Tax=Paraburkholderia hospita TaxID=169430 RepID=A0ABN0FFU9_9BURK|nr:major facilitator superfamily protein [Paraburkholderia hospita]
MMTILWGTIVQDLMWTKGYGAVSGMLSFPSNVAKGVAPIAAASIWNFTRGYVAVEWTVFLVSILSVTAFFLAVRVSRHATTALRDISRLRVQHSYIRHEDTCRTK